MKEALRPASNGEINGSNIRFRRLTTFIITFALGLYVASFYTLRFGVRASAFPTIYIFSSDPVKNKLAHTFFKPMIFMSGGISTMPSERENVSENSRMQDNRPVYLIGSEQVFVRIAGHYNAFFAER